MAQRALIVGINRYPNPAHHLNGCVNDARQVRALLRGHYGFDGRGETTLLLDSQASTAAIRSGLSWLVESARAGDVLVFHYSGHGSQVPDRDGDETTDGLDEIICPWDLDWDDPIADDDLCAAVATLPGGAALTVVLDCCHSGTGLREAAPAARRERFMSPPVAAPADRLPAPGPPVRGALRSPGTPTPGARTVHRFGNRAAEAGAVLIAGCRADQTSADAYIEGAFHGALTYFLCRALEGSAYRLAYDRLVRHVRASLRAARFEQDPQLEGPAALLQSLAFSPPPAPTPPRRAQLLT